MVSVLDGQSVTPVHVLMNASKKITFIPFITVILNHALNYSNLLFHFSCAQGFLINTSNQITTVVYSKPVVPVFCRDNSC